MDVRFAQGAVLAAIAAMIAIRAPHGARSRKVPVAKSVRAPLDTAVLAFAMVAFLVPFVWVATPWLDAAERPLEAVPYWTGVALLAVGLWVFHRSHADLGTNWSIRLDLREGHSLVTSGVYRTVRHPMYLALFLYSAGQALALPNAIAGPSYGVAMLLLFAVRVGPEERMLRDRFGPEWDAYAARTTRLIPGVW